MHMKTIRISIIVALILVVAATYVYLQISSELDRMRSDDPRVWEPVIASFEKLDQQTPPIPNGMLFLGSSTIRLWSTLADDMQPLNAIGRGFGGAKIVDVSYYVERLVKPYQPRAIVLYIGGNDFSTLSGNKPKTPEQALLLYSQLLLRLKTQAPDTVVHILALKPTVSAMQQWSQIREVNVGLQALAVDKPMVTFFDANAVLYNSQGHLDDSLYRFDGVHLSRAGYEAWGQAVKDYLHRLYL